MSNEHFLIKHGGLGSGQIDMHKKQSHGNAGDVLMNPTGHQQAVFYVFWTGGKTFFALNLPGSIYGLETFWFDLDCIVKKGAKAVTRQIPFQNLSSLL